MIVFARRASGGLAHIDEVDNGKACSCHCLACNEALIARQGEKLAHSFAHQSGTQCDHALQAMLHGVAVELIARRGKLVTPALSVGTSIDGPYGRLSDTRQRTATTVPVESVALEQRAPWSRGCIAGRVKGRELLIHIAVHRKSGAPTREALAVLDQAAMEIDLTRHFPQTVAEFARILFTADPRKSWLFNHREQELRAEMQSALTARADALRREQQEATKARQAQRARELAEQARLRAAALATEAEFLRLSAAAQVSQGPASPPQHHKPAAPAELSLNIEYRSREGRLWLLHSERAEMYFKIEPAVQHALQVLERCGAAKDSAEIYRISREGWSNALIELRNVWLAVRSC